MSAERLWTRLWTKDKQSVDPVRTGHRKHRSGSGHDVCETGMELIVFQDKKNLPREAKGRSVNNQPYPRSCGPRPGYQMCFVQGSRVGEREIENIRRWDWGQRRMHKFTGFGRHVRFFFRFCFFFEPKSRFLTTPRIYIFRGREAVINDSLRRCGPVKIDCHLGCNSNPREIPRVIARSLLL